MTIAMHWLRAFVLTQAVESGIYAATLSGRPRRERWAIALAASAITHPAVFFIFPAFATTFELEGGAAHQLSVVASEAFAWIVEALWLFSFGHAWYRALLWSALANGASFSVGLLCYTLLW